LPFISFLLTELITEADPGLLILCIFSQINLNYSKGGSYGFFMFVAVKLVVPNPIQQEFRAETDRIWRFFWWQAKEKG
jgi:hypothetical protein